MQLLATHGFGDDADLRHTGALRGVDHSNDDRDMLRVDREALVAGDE